MKKLLLLAVCILTTASQHHSPSPFPQQRLHLLRDSLEKQVIEWLDSADIQRLDGNVYAIDVAQLMLYFAWRKSLRQYLQLHQIATKNLIHDDPNSPYTRGFVRWRFRQGEPLDASGTTEALRLAKALWIGGETFARQEDRQLALIILDGYMRHEYVDQQIWLIRNYYNYGNKAFANNSFLVDYDPDFLATVAVANEDDKLAEVARRSYDVVEQAKAPCGLLYDMVQPEVKTLYPDIEVAFFSPNDVIQLSNTCTVAETVYRGAPHTAQRILDFAMRDFPPYFYYYGRDGKPVQHNRLNTTGAAGLVRLARRLESPFTHLLVRQYISHWEKFANNPKQPKLYTAGEILLCLQTLLS